ncbi:hypothetical protein FOT72_22580 [Citrobacter amalonaticus]|uniref:Uncharacterized protein n=1 Tax=Citrobacter amalonaticus TaxID=35703 RepID=A0A8I0T2E0_CITAM|nr:hypothetical protein [Citrobacter amalonaticus]
MSHLLVVCHSCKTILDTTHFN